VFVFVADPVGAGFVDSLARPGGNATGVVQFEYSLSGKWLDLLKQIAPGVMRAAIIRDAAIAAGIGQFAVIQSMAPLRSALSVAHRDLIITLAARYKLPAVYYRRHFAIRGGLISFGPNLVDQYRRAVGYVDGILKGEKAANLPVQAPTKYELVINLKTAEALGLTVSPTLLSRADEVIE